MTQEREQPSPLLTSAELADLVAHEVNNLLNSVVLHLALLERSLPEQTQPLTQELGVIRQAINRAGTMLRRWQQIGPKSEASLDPLDLNRVVRDLPVPPELRNASGEVISVRFLPAAGLPPVLGNVADLTNLVRLLLRNAASASPAGSTIAVRTEAASGQVILSVEDQGPAVTPDVLERAFEPFATLRNGPIAASTEDEMLLAICKVLARRQKSTINAANRTDGGLVITVRFLAASTE